MRLAGRVAIVTECGEGETYGVVWARALAREGARVVVADRDDGLARRVAASLGDPTAAVGTALDVGSDASCEAVVALARARFGRVDALVATHHLWHDLHGDDASDGYLHEVLDYNAVSLVRLVRAAIPTMRAQGGGRVVALSSIGAWQVGDRLATRLRDTGTMPSLAYPASKALQNGLTRFLATAVGQFGITVNAIAPGMITSPATMARLSAAERDAFVARTALRRILHVEDTVGTLLFLVSDDASMMTGQVLVVDAGLVMRG